MACRDARDRLFSEIAKEWNVEKKFLQAHDGEIWANGTNYKMPMSDAVKICKKNME